MVQEKTAHGKDIFTLEWNNDSHYIVNYYDNKGENQEIGQLEIVQDI